MANRLVDELGIRRPEGVEIIVCGIEVDERWKEVSSDNL